MTQTLQRERRQKFLEILEMYYQDNPPTEEATKYNTEVADKLAEASISRGEKFQPKTIEQAIFAGTPITEEMVYSEILKDTAPKMFEAALGFSKPLPWWSGKECTEFAEWVCAEYSRSKTSFGEYNIWRNTPYTKGGMANTRIRGFVKEFYDSWDMFKMASGKVDQPKPKTFDPAKEEKLDFVKGKPRG